MNEEVQYQQLEAEHIKDTVKVLSDRIEERFPGSGLWKVSRKLHEITERAQQQADWISRPIKSVRLIAGLLIGIIVIALLAALCSIEPAGETVTLIEFISAFESAVNDLVLIAVAIFFLGTLERRLKRHRALKAINELRAIAHLIDMHQLTKDPVRMHWESTGVVEPKKKMTPFQLTRYLDYCSEMLALVSKTSVLYVQNFDDSVALSAVNDVENLTTGLSRKIWQKLMIIQKNS